MPAQSTSASLLDVYVSYAWGGESEALVDEIERQLPPEFRLVRDKNKMRAGDWISRFMQDIGRAERVIVVISEKYLHSVYCMRELLYLYGTSAEERERMMQRIIPLVVGDLACARARDRRKYVKHWAQEHKELDAALNEDGVDAAGEADRRELLAIQSFKQHVSDLLAWIADTLMPRGQAVATDGIAAAIQLLRERAPQSAAVAAPFSRQPDPLKTGSQSRSIPDQAVSQITRCLDATQAYCKALAAKAGLNTQQPKDLAAWLCAPETNVHAAIRHLRVALAETVELLRGDPPAIAILKARAKDILGWLVITAVTEGCEREDAELAKSWFDGVAFQIPLGRSPCVEVLTARWRGQKAEFDPDRPRYAYGENDITPQNFQEMGFDDPAKLDTTRQVNYVCSLAYKKIYGETVDPNRLSQTQKDELRASLDEEIDVKKRRLHLVIDRNDLDSALDFRAVVNDIRLALPQLHLIIVDSSQPAHDGIFVVPAAQLAAAIQGFLDEIKTLT